MKRSALFLLGLLAGLNLFDFILTGVVLRLGFFECNFVSRIIYDNFGYWAMPLIPLFAFALLYWGLRKIKGGGWQNKFWLGVYLLLITVGLYIQLNVLAVNYEVLRIGPSASCPPGSIAVLKIRDRVVFSYTYR